MDHDSEDLLAHNKRLQETNTYLQNVLTHLTKQLEQCRQCTTCRSVTLRHNTSCLLPFRNDSNDGNDSNDSHEGNEGNDGNDSNEGNDGNDILSPKFHGNNIKDIDYDDIPSPNLRGDDVLSPALRSDNDDSDISNSNNIPSRVAHGSNSSNKNIVSTYPKLKIFPYNPKSDSRRSRNTSQSVSKPEWQKSADKLVGNNLSTVRSKILLYNKKQCDDRIGSILGQFDSFIEPGSLPPSAHTPLMRVRKFACANISSKRIASFRDLLVVSACQVLRHCGHDRSEIDKTLQLCVSDSSSGYLARILKGSQWVGEQICALRETWGHLATECIYHSGMSPRDWSILGANPSLSTPYIRALLLPTKATGKETPEPMPSLPSKFTPLSIPPLVQKLIGTEFSLEVICEATHDNLIPEMHTLSPKYTTIVNELSHKNLLHPSTPQKRQGDDLPASDNTSKRHNHATVSEFPFDIVNTNAEGCASTTGDRILAVPQVYSPTFSYPSEGTTTSDNVLLAGVPNGLHCLSAAAAMQTIDETAGELWVSGDFSLQDATGQSNFQANHEQVSNPADQLYPTLNTTEYENAEAPSPASTIDFDYCRHPFDMIDIASFSTPRSAYPPTPFPIDIASFTTPRYAYPPMMFPIDFASFTTPRSANPFTGYDPVDSGYIADINSTSA